VAKKESKGGDGSTIENRVYLFDSLASTLLSGPAGDLLASADDAERGRVLRALGDLAWVSCAFADGAILDAAAVRDQVASPAAPPPPAEPKTAKPKKPKAKA
jgi:hypothetical protein